MIATVPVGPHFDAWRDVARQLLAASVRPADVIWTAAGQGALFDPVTAAAPMGNLSVPRAFIDMGRAVACFDNGEKWDVLYRILFRLVHGEHRLLEVLSDPDIVAAKRMEKAVNRDVHKFHAFVRFREVSVDDEEFFAAWYEPHHFTVERATPFFMRRFGNMRFSILTPKGCAHWDRRELTFTEAADRRSAPTEDELEDLWLLYYRSIFNPYRLKVNAMKKEFPKRHWATLPEAALIPELIRNAVCMDESEPA